MSLPLGFVKIQLAAGEREKFVVGDRKADGPAGLDDDFGQNIPGIDHGDAVRASPGDDRATGRIENLRDDVEFVIVRFPPAAGDGEDRFDNAGIAGLALRLGRRLVAGRQNDDRFAGGDGGDVEIGDRRNRPGPGHDPSVATLGFRQAKGEEIIHFFLFSLSQDANAGIFLAFVGPDQLAEDFQDALRLPAENEGVAVLDHPGMAFAEGCHPVDEPCRDHADQC